MRQDLSQRANVSPEKLQVVEAIQKVWPDSCLGLAKLDEMCGQVLVEGWEVILSDGNQHWVYHTDKRGEVYRLVETTN